MSIELELSIPPHFFDSAREENNYESVSEKIAKVFLKEVCGVDDIHRGDDKKSEPDYVSNNSGYEVTFATAEKAGTQEAPKTMYMFNPVKVDDEWKLCVKTATDDHDESFE